MILEFVTYVAGIILILTLVQIATDKYECESSPYTFLNWCATKCQDFWYWLGEWFGVCLSVVIRIKDAIGDVITWIKNCIWDLFWDFVPALVKIVYPIWRCVWSFLYMGKGFASYLVAFMAARTPGWNYDMLRMHAYFWVPFCVLLSSMFVLLWLQRVDR